MPLRVQILGHSPIDAAAFVGLEREVTFELVNNRLRLHDNITPGGIIIPNADQISVLISALGTTLTANIDALTANKMNRSVITDANEVVIGTAANTEATLAMAAQTMLARLAAGDVVAATPVEIRTLLTIDDFVLALGALGTTANRLLKTSGVDTAVEIVLSTIGESVIAAPNESAIRALLDTPSAGEIDSAIAAGLVSLIPTGTVMCFFQAAAPSGWTQVVTQNDKVFRVVSGAGGGSGGDWEISGVTVDGHALTIAELAAHTHSTFVFAGTVHLNGKDVGNNQGSTGTTGSTGSGDTHTHGLTADSNWRPAYIDVILASKDA